MRNKMKYQIKDRVKLVETKKENDVGTIVKLYKAKNGKIRTCGVLWDNDWPKDNPYKQRFQPGKVFYYKPEDLCVVDTWRI